MEWHVCLVKEANAYTSVIFYDVEVDIRDDVATRKPLPGKLECSYGL